MKTKYILAVMAMISCCLTGFAQEEKIDSIAIHRLDSLMCDWYVGLSDSNIKLELIDTNQFKTSVPDSVLIQRLEDMNSFITLPFNATVKNYMVLYAEKSRTKMERILALADYYFPIFEATFAKYDMPLELKYMAIIESALNPIARSRAGARGIWQFMFNTGKLYGLKIDSFVDERLDVEKAVDAAARYLLDAYKTFEDWNLAISAYNCGAGNVNKAIRRSGSKQFWDLYPYLPRETRGYVPAMVGAMYAMTYRDEYGLRKGETILPIQTDTMVIHKNLHFKQVSEIIGVPIDILREMNPQYVHDIVPGNSGNYILKIPFTYAGDFVAKEDTLYAHKADSLMSPKVLKNISQGGNGSSIVYVVRSGDNLGKIAQKYHTTVNNLRRWNGISGSMIRIGQRLTIYTNGAGPQSTNKEETKTAYTYYTVQAGDTLYKIAGKYPGVTPDDIMKLNGISSNIKAGARLMIPSKG